MRFLSPLWLWGLLVLPVLFGVYFLDERRKRKLFSRFAHPDLWSLIAPEMDPKQRLRKGSILLASLAFSLIALARPQFGTHEESVQLTGLDVMLILDVSTSMDVEDAIPSRMKKAKHMIRTLLEPLQGDRVGVVAFAGSSYIASPLTPDLDFVWGRVQALNTQTIRAQGTDVGGGLETALRTLESGSEEESGDSSLSSRVMILISDGEDHEEGANAVAERIRKSGIQFYAFGLGTEKGGPIPLLDEAGINRGYKKDRSGQPIVSRFRPDALKEIAEKAGGKYWSVSIDESEVKTVQNEILAMQRSDYGERRFLIYEDRFQFPLALAVLLFFVELALPVRRKAVLGILFLTLGSSAYARSPAPSLDVYLENRKGLKAYQEGRVKEAEQSFGAAQARDPSRPELEFNQGAVQIQNGDLGKAIDSFKQSAQAARDRRDSEMAARSFYNLGVAQTHGGELDQAMRSYIDAIEEAQKAKNDDLEKAARKNLQLLQEEQQQKKKEKREKKSQEQREKESDQSDPTSQSDQKNEENSEGESQNPSQSQDRDQNQDSDPDQDQDQNGEENQNKDHDQKEKDGKSGEQEDPRREKDSAKSREFRSKKMTKEDAERVMSELLSKEQGLQERLQTKHGKLQPNAKDW